jgi:1-acyl-sn-glycerol-3-phosphate acyltransferase
MTIVSADFALRQDRYVGSRQFIRDFLLRGLAFHVLARVSVEGLANVPEQGPAIIVYNHGHAIDPAVVAGAVSTRFVVPMSKIENFRLPIFGQLIRWWGAYPVRRGQYDRSAVQHTIDLLREGHPVLIAPEGTRQPALIRGKDGVAFAAARTGAPIVPVGIDGTLAFGHNLKRLRRTPIMVRFGRAFRLQRQGEVRRDDLTRITDQIMYQIAGLLPEHRRGYYRDLDRLTTDVFEFMQ